jgi:serine phosphatase RsbU (regulator of sigma subunit)
MPGSFRDTPAQTVSGAVRQLLTRTFAGRALLTGVGLKLLVRLTRVLLETERLSFLDALGDIALVIGAVLLIRRLFEDARGMLLWRVRRKLTLSYIFIGFVPVLLIIIFFLTAGLILFFNVSQYVAVSRIDALVEQAAFLADSAAIGLQGVESEEDLQRRMRRRQTGAERTYPFASYAVVPTTDACSTGTATSPPIRLGHPVVVGSWAHVDAPSSLPAWLGCRSVSGLITYSNDADKDRGNGALHLAARAVAHPDDPAARFAVVVDIPLSRALLGKMKADTGIDYGLGNAAQISKREGAHQREICNGLPLPGHDINAGAQGRSSGPEQSGRAFGRPLSWVARARYVDWSTGESCEVTIGIRMTLGEMFARIGSIPGDSVTNNFTYYLLGILALIGVCFLLIQIVAFITGLALARSITGSVHELFTGTERVRLGDFSHKIPIKTRDQLGELAQSFNSMTRSIADLLQQKAEKERMEQELRIARNIQMSLLPRDAVTVPGLTVTAHCEPAREVGGDYYDYMNVGDHRLGLLIADVSGKGTSAALYMAELKGLMLSLSQLHTSPRELLISANTILANHLDSRSFITITYAVVDVVGRTLTYARAGHCPLIYVPGPYASSRAVQILAPDGLVLGLQIDDGGQRFSRLLEEVTLPLGTGDVFLFYTDGLTEAMDGEGNIFGDVRLGAVVQEHADAPFDELRDTILREIGIFAGPTAQQDDMTMLLLRVEEVGAAGAVVSHLRH